MRELRTLEYVGIAITFFFGLFAVPQEYAQGGIGRAFGAFVGVILIGYAFTWCLCNGWDSITGLFKPKSSEVSSHQTNQSPPIQSEGESPSDRLTIIATIGALLIIFGWVLGYAVYGGLYALTYLGFILLVFSVFYYGFNLYKVSKKK